MNENLPTSAHILNKIIEEYYSNPASNNEVFKETIQKITANIIEKKKKFYTNLHIALSDIYSEPQNITLKQVLPFLVLAINNYYKDEKNQVPYLTDYIADMDSSIRNMADSYYLKYFDGEPLNASLSTGD